MILCHVNTFSCIKGDEAAKANRGKILVHIYSFHTHYVYFKVPLFPFFYHTFFNRQGCSSMQAHRGKYLRSHERVPLPVCRKFEDILLDPKHCL